MNRVLNRQPGDSILGPNLGNRPALSRRAFVRGAGALVLSFSLRPALFAQTGLPGNLRRQPELDAWLRIGTDGAVTLFTGKVEIGQGIVTALAQIAAEELDVAVARIEVITADTERTPNEGITAGSTSVEQSGAAIRQAAAELRHLLLERAAARLGVDAARLDVVDGVVAERSESGAAATNVPTLSYGELVVGAPLNRPATGAIAPKNPSQHRVVGTSVPRLDIPAKVFGEPAYVHDLRLPGMLHARVVRPSSYSARLVAPLSTAATLRMPGVVQVVRDGSFLAVVAEREEQAVGAARQLAGAANFEGAGAVFDTRDVSATLRAASSQRVVVRERVASSPMPAAVELAADYSKPFLAHASIGPSCAVAQLDGAETEKPHLSVWSHSQGVFGLRSALGRVLGLPEDRIQVIHRQGAGCYGHNGADDVALDAALLARAMPGRPIRVVWSREDEFRWEPFGSAMSFHLAGGVTRDGRLAHLSSELWSYPHSTRPGREPNLLASWHRATPLPSPAESTGPLSSGGMDRNSIPLYDVPTLSVIAHPLLGMPIRVSALRSLGAFGNIFALESFIDELALAAGIDPLRFRLQNLGDPRAKAVLEAAAHAAGWTAPAAAASSAATMGRRRGRGLGFARYKNTAAYLAVVVEATVTLGESPENGRPSAIELDRITAAVDAGQVVNPDGLRNQIEGGILQAASWTLFEEVKHDGERITSSNWSSYPILTFSHAPDVRVEIIDRKQEPSLGVGEAAQGPTAAAIANAVYDACRARVRDLPLLPRKVRVALAARG